MSMESDYTPDRRLSNQYILTTKNAEFEKVLSIIETYFHAKLKPFTSAGSVQRERESSLQYTTNNLDTLS